MSNLLLRRRMMMAGGSPTPPTPIIQKPFSVGANKQVYFSPGNLQWSATNGSATATTHAVAGGGTAAGTWRFAPNQWDYVGDANNGTVYGVGGDPTIKCNNANIGQNYQGWIDLFGWGTSGYNSKYPYMIYAGNSYYGDGNNDISNTNYDWGVYNAIYNPKTNTTDPAGTWRTITKDEVEYLLSIRSTVSGMRYAKALVNGVKGLIIFPDDWDTSIYTINNANVSYGNIFDSNTIGGSDWVDVLEENGCILWSAAGHRSGTSPGNSGLYGNYWTGTAASSTQAYQSPYSHYTVAPSYADNRNPGHSVRLVKDVI